MVREKIERMDVPEYADEGNYVADMSLNQNPLGAPEKVIERIREIEESKISSYTHFHDAEEKVAHFLNVDAEKVMLTDGCDGALDLLAQAFFSASDEVAVAVPSFPRYETHVRKMSAEPVFGKNPENLDADHLIMANPENPSGEKKTVDQILGIAERFEGHVIIDEAMVDPVETHADLVCEDITVAGSFSKFFGLAGLRAGYIVSSEIENIRKVSSPFKINSIAVEGVKAAIDDLEHIQETRKLIGKELDYLKAEMDRIGVGYSDSVCMTLLLEFSETSFEGDASRMHDELLERGIKTVKASHFRGLDDNYLRISARDHETNRLFVETLEEILDQGTVKNSGGEN